MRIFNRLLAAVALVILATSSSCAEKENTDPSPKPDNESDKAVVKAPHIFVSGKDGYHTFRIPAIVKSKKGTLLAFCEGRKISGSDTGDINLVLRRSTDGGTSWSGLITVWDDGLNTCGNPSPVVDPVTGRIHLLMTWNYQTDGKSAGDFNKDGVTKDTRRVWYTCSDDDGLTWADPEEITSSVKKDDWGWYATGPCHGIVLTKAPYEGRIVIPCDYNQKGGSGYSHVIYSDDNGRNWKIGGSVKGGNESSVAEMGDGRLIISCRMGGGMRLLAYSSDGGATFTSGTVNRSLPDPKCQGTLLSAVKDGEDVLLHCNCSNSSSRTHLTLKGSTDYGATWCGGQTVWEKPAAYSDIVLVRDEIVGVLYENGDNGSYERISFEKVPLGYAFIK